MMSVFTYDTILKRKRFEDIIIPLPKNKKIWIDLTDPTKDELDKIGKLFGIHPLVLEDLTTIYTRPKIDLFREHTFIVLYGLYKPKENNVVKTLELDFIIGKNYVISSHSKPVGTFERLKSNSEKLRTVMAKGADFVLHKLIDLEVDNYMPLLEEIDDYLEELEDRVMVETGPGIHNKLFLIKREVLRIRKVAGPQRILLARLAKKDSPFISESALIYFGDVLDHMIRVNDIIDNYREIISSTLDVNLSVSSNKMNEIMKVLTIIATIMLPLTVIGSIYGMNFKHMPELEWKYGYLAVWLVMIAVAAFMILYFKRRDWI